MSTGTLYDKVFDQHVVRDLGDQQYQILVGLHLFHEATTAPAFAMLRERGLNVAFPERNVGTVDHIIPTDEVVRPFTDNLAEEMMRAIERNTKDFGLRLLHPDTGLNGIVPTPKAIAPKAPCVAVCESPQAMARPRCATS